MGVIDTLTAGFDRVTNRLWLILIPVLVDIAIWIGPRLSVAKLSRSVAAALPGAAELGSQYEQALQLARERIIDLGAGANVVSLLSMRAMGLPSLTATFSPQAHLFAATPRVIEIQTWAILLVSGAVLVLLSLLIGCLSLSCIAQAARHEDIGLRYTLQLTGRSWIRLAALVLAGLVVIATVVIGMSVVYSILAVLSPQLAWLALNLLSITALWFSIYAGVVFFFTPRAIVLDDMGLLHSLWSSMMIVHRNFWSVVGFVLLVTIIQAGLLHIWRMLAISTAGTLAGIVGNAYVSTGLVMASFIFYRDKFVAWQEAVRKAQADKGQL